MMLLVGTDAGLFGDGKRLVDGPVVGLSPGPGGWRALVGGVTLWGPDGPVATLPEGPPATCLLTVGDDLLVGTREAHLVRVSAEGRAEPVPGFEEAEGRETWYTPWGAPADARSMTAGAGGDPIYVNVHVGGILRSGDGGASWMPTIDVHSDVHQVVVEDGTVYAATAFGLARSDDAGVTWTFSTEGLHGSYCRALAVAGDWLLLSASTGHQGRQAAVFRRPLHADGAPFERCRTGLPEWFADNVNTACLSAVGSTVAMGTADGLVFRSDDTGATWELVARDQPGLTCLLLA